MYDDRVVVMNEATKVSVECDVMDFNEKKKLIAVVNQVKISMYYENRTKKYIGTMAGMDFISDGPKELGV